MLLELAIRRNNHGSSDRHIARHSSIFSNVAPGREAEFEEWFQHGHGELDPAASVNELSRPQLNLEPA
jgi:hypothetical protein